MKHGNKHLILGTVICAATMLLFLAFNSKLPDIVPLQIALDGSVGNTLPKPLLVFGMPIFFTGINLVRGLSLARREDPRIFNYYLVPAVAVAASIVTIWMALSM